MLAADEERYPPPPDRDHEYRHTPPDRFGLGELDYADEMDEPGAADVRR